MRLHWIRLRNFGGVTDSGKVKFATTGVTVVEGPNEVGKTSMPEALDLIIDKLDSAKTKAIRSVQPVGRDVGPEVEIEMSSGDYRFVYSKRWLRNRSTTLEVIAPQREKLSGRAAHDRVIEILEETLDTNLWAALRIEQGQELWLPDFAETSLGQALDHAVGGQFASEREESLWTRIQTERDSYCTPTGRPSTERKTAEAQVEEARQEADRIEQQLRGIESDSDEMARRAADTQRLEETRRDSDKQAGELSEQWDATEHLRGRIQELRTANESAETKRDSIDGEQRRRQTMIEDHEAGVDRLKALMAEAERAAPALAAASQRSEETDQATETARQALKDAEKTQRRAGDDRDHHKRQIDVAMLQERHERIVKEKQALSDAASRLETAKVDDELLEKIEQAHIAAASADAAFTTGAASVEVTATRDLALRIDGEEVALNAGEAKRSVVDVETVWTIPDVAQMRVTSGRGSKNLASQRRDAQDALRRLCEAGGVADVSEARKAARERNDAERRRDEAAAAIERDLRDLTVEGIETKITGLNKWIESYRDERTDDAPLPPDFEAAKQIASDADRAVDERRGELDANQKAAERAAETLKTEQIKAAGLDGQIKTAHSECSNAEERLAEARQERADADIVADLAAAAQAAHSSQESLDASEAELRATDPDSLKAKLDNARKAVERARADLLSNKERQVELRGRLEIQGEQGLRTRLDEKQSELSHLEREHESVEARARAAALLYETFDRFRKEARQRYMAPFKQEIDRLGRIVFNPSFEVTLDEDLCVTGRTLDGDTLTADQLSTGAQEQIGVLCRLACAAIVSPDGGGAPVIIDDALGWSDPARLRGMGAAIAASSGDCQVIILTCTPDRYSSIGNATTVRLPSGGRGPNGS
ncbi:MAG: hypothetical protein OXE79_10210 [Acidimicrobiaceae bacterium]|nr:hypothetical protein [Acidimicrobiaceae bacterium]MCY4280007.1 hypothetical protein [Acidimicrobiaceae bacterium]MCY4294929.1 hypothetical protein [Acidimicrobiaceae bacterium]